MQIDYRFLGKLTHCSIADIIKIMNTGELTQNSERGRTLRELGVAGAVAAVAVGVVAAMTHFYPEAVQSVFTHTANFLGVHPHIDGSTITPQDGGPIMG